MLLRTLFSCAFKTFTCFIHTGGKRYEVECSQQTVYQNGTFEERCASIKVDVVPVIGSTGIYLTLVLYLSITNEVKF